ncbi:hypothetical protein Q5P01_008617 [Channa striata]|uniref:Uncharacterized protein n=1 Tax=Channa striata TaxID=64152 RepID=A0AA88N732_CHASR|nr:hypothetical protein Q5P01_008617 [Channa striata]
MVQDPATASSVLDSFQDPWTHQACCGNHGKDPPETGMGHLCRGQISSTFDMFLAHGHSHIYPACAGKEKLHFELSEVAGPDFGHLCLSASLVRHSVFSFGMLS